MKKIHRYICPKCKLEEVIPNGLQFPKEECPACASKRRKVIMTEISVKLIKSNE